MEYIARPVKVNAHKIVSVQMIKQSANDAPAPLRLALDNGEGVTATVPMLSRMSPVPGDYWVIQEDGYIYLNPKDVFERKYMPKSEYDKNQENA